MAEPLYNEETLGTCWHILVDLLIPKLFLKEWSSPQEWAISLQGVRRNYMARAGLEAALWDLFAQTQDQSLASLWGSTLNRVEVGVSLGIQESPGALLAKVEEALAQGYRRVKLKIKPGADFFWVEAVRESHPELRLWVDANSAYRLDVDLPLLQRLDSLGLELIEQPLAHDDIVDHARLQPLLRTPICLDESIHSLEDCRKALGLGACRVINVKPGRVGGFWEAQQIVDFCQKSGISCGGGGMLETGIGRLGNLALASLPGFDFPGDISASSRYFEKDLIQPEVELGPYSQVEVPNFAGWQQRIDFSRLRECTRAVRSFKAF